MRWASLLALSMTALVVTPAAATTLFGLIDTGELYSSPDNGASWSALAALPVHDAVALSARTSSLDLIAISRFGSVYGSSDGGLTWTAVGVVPAHDVVDLAILPNHNGVLLVMTAAGSLYQSTDQGASFTALAALVGSSFVSLTVTASGAACYALTRTGEVYESTDGGTSWEIKGAVAVPDAQQLRSSPAGLCLLTASGDVLRSTDAGATWVTVGTLSQVGMRGLARIGTSLVAASREGHVAISSDGMNWTWRGSINQLTLTALATDEPVTTSTQLAPTLEPSVLSVGPPFPNPSRGRVSFVVRAQRDDVVRLTVYDLAGRRVAHGEPQSLGAGAHLLTWVPRGVAAGSYVVRIEGHLGVAAARTWVVAR